MIVIINLKNKTASYSTSKRWVYSRIAENYNLGQGSYSKAISKSTEQRRGRLSDEGNWEVWKVVIHKVQQSKVRAGSVVAPPWLGCDSFWRAGLFPWGGTSFLPACSR